MQEAMEVFVARPKLRTQNHKENIQSLFHNHFSDWLKLPLDEIDRRMVVERHMFLQERPRRTPATRVMIDRTHMAFDLRHP